jgi:hypothetical protein
MHRDGIDTSQQKSIAGWWIVPITGRIRWRSVPASLATGY